jgi:hypothetical protein
MFYRNNGWGNKSKSPDCNSNKRQKDQCRSIIGFKKSYKHNSAAKIRVKNHQTFGFINKICTFEQLIKNSIMNWTDIFNGTGRFFQWTFRYMKHFGNVPNVFFWIIIISLIVVWLRMQTKFNKEAKEKGTLQ